VDITYIAKSAATSSNVLVVAFPGEGGLETGDYGYLMTLGRFDVNRLFIKFGREERANHYHQCALIYRNREPVFEETIIALINQICGETRSTQIITVGSSMGGFDAMYYGLKYDWDIISGAPYWTFPTEWLLHLAGGTDTECQKWADNMLETVVKQAGERGRDGKSIFLCWGEGESVWCSPVQGPKLLKQLDEYGIKYTYTLFNYQTHMQIHRAFPKILETRLSILLGLAEENFEINKTDELVLTDFIKDKLKSLSTLPETLFSIPMNFNIDCRVQYAENNKNNVLRNYVYMQQGYFWHPGWKEPQNTGSPKNYWSKIPTSCVAGALAFIFPQTILNYYINSHDIEALKWCGDTLRRFLDNIRGVASANTDYNNWWNADRRLHFLINYICCVNNSSKKDELYNDIDAIHHEIIHCFQIILNEVLLLADCESQYRRINTLLHIAVLYAADEDFSEKLSNTGLEILDKLTNFYFDKNGVCLIGQSRVQYILRNRLKEIIEFIEANFEADKHTKSLRRKYDKINEVTAFLIAPNGLRPALGHSDDLQITDVLRKTGIFAKPESNIAVFSADNSYITIQSGPDIHATLKHCDLLSFTFFYDNQQIILDSQGGNGQLADFAQSAIAHSALIMDDKDYSSPTYIDWTTMDNVDIQDDYIVVQMSHSLFVETKLLRTLVWLKPNIIILIDDAAPLNNSSVEHKFTQNFILLDIVVKGTDVVCGKIGTVDFSIKQYDSGFELKQYRGTSTATNKSTLQNDAMRGSIISGYVKTRKGLNLAYNKIGSSASFLTAVEAHSVNSLLKKHELTVTDLRLDNGNLIITLADVEKIMPLLNDEKE
jgi:hypothetical protein